MAILELVVNQRYYDQLVINRYHYVSTGEPAAVTPSFALIAATGYLTVTGNPGAFASGTLAHALAQIQNTELIYVSAYARNLYSVTDFYERPYAVRVDGDSPGEQSSPALAFGFFSSRTRTDIRRGSKRFAGVSETSIGVGGTIAAGVTGNMDTVSTKLGTVITYDDEGNTISFAPAVLGLEEYTTESGNRAYRPYATEIEQLAHLSTGMTWAYKPNVRTQVSRQYGRGS